MNETTKKDNERLWAEADLVKAEFESLARVVNPNTGYTLKTTYDQIKQLMDVMAAVVDKSEGPAGHVMLWSHAIKTYEELARIVGSKT